MFGKSVEFKMYLHRVVSDAGSRVLFKFYSSARASFMKKLQE